MKIGALELVVIFVVALLVLGPDKLPQYARKFGAALREFRKASSDATEEIRKSVIDPLEEAQKPLREAMEPIEDLGAEVKANFRGVENSLNNLGKTETKKEAAPAARSADGHAPEDNEEAAAPAETVPANEENGGTDI